jgi:hypothetical protein
MVMFRIIEDGEESIVDVHSTEQIEPAIRSGASGRYHIDEIRANPLPRGHTSRRCGVVTMRIDGSVDLELDT